MSTSKKIILKSSDNEPFEVEEAVALQSTTIAHLIEDQCVGNGVPLANVTSKILVLVIEYCKQHHVTEDGDSLYKKEQLKKWDANFMNIDQSTLSELMLAANYLNIKDLLDLTCQTVADMITGKSVDEIRTTFNIENDFTPEEEAAARSENQWAFE